MLELRDPELELVELVARHEVELVGDPAQHRDERLLRELARGGRADALGSSARSSSTASRSRLLLPRAAMRPRATPLATASRGARCAVAGSDGVT